MRSFPMIVASFCMRCAFTPSEGEPLNVGMYNSRSTALLTKIVYKVVISYRRLLREKSRLHSQRITREMPRLFAGKPERRLADVL